MGFQNNAHVKIFLFSNHSQKDPSRDLCSAFKLRYINCLDAYMHAVPFFFGVTALLYGYDIHVHNVHRPAVEAVSLVRMKIMLET